MSFLAQDNQQSGDRLAARRVRTTIGRLLCIALLIGAGSARAESIAPPESVYEMEIWRFSAGFPVELLETVITKFGSALEASAVPYFTTAAILYLNQTGGPNYTLSPTTCTYVPGHFDVECTTTGTYTDIYGNPSPTEVTGGWHVNIFPVASQCQTAEGRGNPCSALTGNKHQQDTDLPGRDAVPGFARAYNAQLTAPDAGIGVNWTHEYARRLVINPDKTGVTAHRPDGRIYYFVATNGIWTTDVDVSDRITPIADGWTYQTRAGETETYAADGRLQTLTDPRGRTTRLDNDAQGRLVSITGPHGHSVSLTYSADGHVAKVTGPVGETVGYSYDSPGRLTTVTYADGAVRTYHYENA
ncbi:MAG TPA: DUF6531 domain-containing protein, partial [Acidiferrobacterales bacterium]|nr:DUF6531 domain-containing protein [Acidiferrobacterales bacterium]